MLEYEVAVGKPAPEILRVARERSCDLIVISTHGLTGMRKLFFGSTTERVLRETTRPVLVTPPHDPGPLPVEDAQTADPPDHRAGGSLAGVDSSDAGRARHRRGAGVPLILVHVIEPLKSRLAARLHWPASKRPPGDGRRRPERAAGDGAAPASRRGLVAYGDPAEELAKVARDRQAGLIVVGLHGSPLLGPRMGSVTYRLLCLSPTLVLALPPKTSAARAVCERCWSATRDSTGRAHRRTRPAVGAEAPLATRQALRR